ncbi:hypothetical protein ACQR1Q_08885 [Bradyrhizobium oligotrophicum]|uniref:hypothetical protein n=1 Tax=Bradyrhizobium oligotrophicum TaxID=44255 RepID=UPI003EB8FB8E
MLSILAKVPTSKDADLEREIARLKDRQQCLQHELDSCHSELNAATTKRRELLETASGLGDDRLSEVNGAINAAQARQRDIGDAIALLSSQLIDAQARFEKRRENEVRAAEAKRVSEMVAKARTASTKLDAALLNFVSAFAPLGMSGDWAATAAAQLRSSVVTHVADAITASEEYAASIANGTKPLPPAVVTAHRKKLTAQSQEMPTST